MEYFIGKKLIIIDRLARWLVIDVKYNNKNTNEIVDSSSWLQGKESSFKVILP